MKRKYEKPTYRVYELQYKCHVLTGNSINSLDTDEFDYVGGGNEPSR